MDEGKEPLNWRKGGRFQPIQSFESSLKQEFVNKFLDGIDFYNESPSSDLKVVDSMEYDFVKHRFPETICNVTERVEML